MCNANAAPNPGYELVLTRLIDAPREKLFRCWTDPQLMKQWFAPLPWTITHAEMELRPGGKTVFVMRSRKARNFPTRGSCSRS